MKITLKKLHIASLVATSRSFSQTAKEIECSPSAVASAISSLEKELGVELFKRHRAQGVVLTEAGKDIVNQADRVLANAVLHLEMVKVVDPRATVYGHDALYPIAITRLRDLDSGGPGVDVAYLMRWLRLPVGFCPRPIVRWIGLKVLLLHHVLWAVLAGTSVAHGAQADVDVDVAGFCGCGSLDKQLRERWWAAIRVKLPRYWTDFCCLHA